MTATPADLTPVYLEIGRRRVFAAAVEWPGWCRAARHEDAAVAALIEYGLRYRRAVDRVAPDFAPPSDTARLDTVERLAGNATTDFGAPAVIPQADRRPVGDNELERLIELLRACWSAFADAADTAEGRALTSGPRGGGRGLEQIRQHVREADHSYLRALGSPAAAAPGTDWTQLQRLFVDALRARHAGTLPGAGPRGGLRWPPRYAIRRAAWHALDHAWEIEDRLAAGQST